MTHPYVLAHEPFPPNGCLLPFQIW